MKKLSMCKYTGEDVPGHPLKPKKTYVYLGDIVQMPGHCVVVDYETGKVHCGYHTDNFRPVIEETNEIDTGEGIIFATVIFK